MKSTRLAHPTVSESCREVSLRPADPLLVPFARPKSMAVYSELCASMDCCYDRGQFYLQSKHVLNIDKGKSRYYVYCLIHRPILTGNISFVPLATMNSNIRASVQYLHSLNMQTHLSQNSSFLHSHHPTTSYAPSQTSCSSCPTSPSSRWTT
jgi:hypothetical protein